MIFKRLRKLQFTISDLRCQNDRLWTRCYELQAQLNQQEAEAAGIRGLYSSLERKYGRLMDYLDIEEVYTPPANTVCKRKKPSS